MVFLIRQLTDQTGRINLMKEQIADGSGGGGGDGGDHCRWNGGW